MAKKKKKIALPKKRSVPQVEMNDWRWLFHSWPKVGKTTLATFFDHPVFAKTEEGTKGLSLYGEDINSWQDMLDFVDLLEDEKHNFKTIVIDPIERLYDYLTEHVADEFHVSHINKLGYGEGYKDCNDRLYRLLEDLCGIMGVVLISHSREMKVTHGAIEITRIVPDLSTSPRKVITGWVDSIVYLEMEETIEGEEGEENVTYGRVAICQPRPDVEAGGRLRYMPERIVLPNPKAGYQNLKKAFDSAVAEFLKELGLTKGRGRKQ